MSERDGYSADAQRYLDGEPFGELSAAERESADRLAAAARAYGARVAPVDPGLDDAVMAAVRGPAPARRRRELVWLVTPQPVRVRPVWVPVFAAAAALVLWLAPWGARPAAGPAVTASAAPPARARPDTVYVRFELSAPNAQTVSLAGSFNGWRTDVSRLTRGAAGVWFITVALPVGEHHYDFVVNGTEWVPDPTAHVQVDDGFGGRNSVIVVGPKGVVRS
jgi:hypothetical protein